MFLSSTFNDLEKTRGKIRDHIRSQRDIVIGMEDFPPDDRYATEYIEEQIKKSDAVILIIAINDGSFTEQDIKYVEHEILCGKKFKKPFFIFRPETETEGTKRFLPFLEKHNITPSMRPYTLSVNESDILTLFTRGYPAIKERLAKSPFSGLIPAEQMRDAFHFTGFNKQLVRSRELSDAVVAFSQARNLVGRAYQCRHEKQAAAFCVFRNLGPQLFPAPCTRNFYLDGGASVIVAAAEFIKMYKRFGTEGTQINLSTNSPHTQMSLLMQKPKRAKNLAGPEIFPDFGYYDTYGTFLGEVMDDWPETSQGYWSSSQYQDLPVDEMKLVKSFRSYFASNRPVIFTSVSGYDISKDKRCNGPWVRSMPNYYFKRQLMELCYPTVVFLDEKKWGRSMLPKKSLCIYSKRQKASEADVPICYSAGFTSAEKYDEFVQHFGRKRGFIVEGIEDYPVDNGAKLAACAYTESFLAGLAPPSHETSQELITTS